MLDTSKSMLVQEIAEGEGAIKTWIYIYSNNVDDDDDCNAQRQLAIYGMYIHAPHILYSCIMTTRAPTNRCVSNVSLRKVLGK